MEIKTFIEKAIEGGWKGKYSELFEGVSLWMYEKDYGIAHLEYRNGDNKHVTKMKKEEIFLDPLAWQAVGKVEGWKGIPRTYKCGSCARQEVSMEGYHIKMRAMIDALAEGKTIEEYIETL